MTAQLAPIPVFRANDNNGNPLVGGQLFTYIAGTVTPQATYVDSTQTTQNTNPVILNARGECNLWLDVTKTYKLVLQDAAGNQIWSVDNINGLLSPTSSIVPTPDNTQNFGSASASWANVFVGANHAPVLDTVSGNIGYYARTAAEIAAGVTPTNYFYATDPQLSIKRYGASNTNTPAQNLTALNNAILVAQNTPGAASLGGVVIAIPPDCPYGYVVTNKTTWPQLSGTTPITVYDYSQGSSYSGYPAAYDGNQQRMFSYTPQTSVVGNMDGNNFLWRGAWAPNIIVSNDADLSGARTALDNRRARFLIFNQGNATWGVGQGVSSSASLTSEQLSNFLIQKFAAPGDTLSSLNSLLIERITGNWMFNAGANLPGASYHFVSTVAGFAQGLFETDFSTTSIVALRNSTGAAQDVSIRNVAGALTLNISSLGDALVVSGTTRLCTLQAIAEAVSATSPAVATGGTIAIGTTGISRVTPTANVTAVILAAGSVAGQEVTVMNQAAFTITFDVAGTSHVADGATSAIPALTARRFVWDGTLWYRHA